MDCWYPLLKVTIKIGPRELMNISICGNQPVSVSKELQLTTYIKLFHFLPSINTKENVN